MGLGAQYHQLPASESAEYHDVKVCTVFDVYSTLAKKMAQYDVHPATMSSFIAWDCGAIAGLMGAYSRV